MKQSLMGVTSSPITCGQTVEKSETCFLFDESGMDREVGVVSSFVVDGAWLAATGVVWELQLGSKKEVVGRLRDKLCNVWLRRQR